MTGFIAVSILSDESAGITVLLIFSALQGEELVEFSRKLLIAAHQFDKVRHVLRHIPAILPCIGLGIGIATVAAVL